MNFWKHKLSSSNLRVYLGPSLAYIFLCFGASGCFWVERTKTMTELEECPPVDLCRSSGGPSKKRHHSEMNRWIKHARKPGWASVRLEATQRALKERLGLNHDMLARSLRDRYDPNTGCKPAYLATCYVTIRRGIRSLHTHSLSKNITFQVTSELLTTIPDWVGHHGSCNRFAKREWRHIWDSDWIWLIPTHKPTAHPHAFEANIFTFSVALHKTLSGPYRLLITATKKIVWSKNRVCRYFKSLIFF